MPLEVKVTNPETEAEAIFDINLGDTTEEAVQQFGELIVHGLYVSAARVAAQGVARGMLKAGRTADEVKVFMETSWKPGSKTRDPITAVMATVSGMTDEERRIFIEDIAARVNAG